MHAGAAKRDITPPAGSDLSGFIARLEPSRGAAEPLHVRALVAEADGRRAAVVQADLLGFSEWHVVEMREFARRRLGVPPEALLCSATHTHSGPGTMPLRGCPLAPPAYQWDVVAKAREALEEAHARRLPAVLETGTLPYPLGVNRRQETPDGVVLGVAPGKPRPETLAVACLRTTEQDILLFSYACHPYVMGGDSLWISGDFPSFACAELEGDERTTALFLNGCAGDISPRSAFQGLERARDEGRRLAAAVRDAAGRLRAAPGEAVAGRSARVHIPYRPLPDEREIEACAAREQRVVRFEEGRNAEVQRRLAAALREWADQLRLAVRRRSPLTPVHCEVQAVRLGALALLGISGEPFYEIGEAIRASSPFPTTWPLAYANAYSGYIPTRKEYPLGGYEVDDAWKYLGMWKTDDTGEERVVSAALEVLGGC